MTFDIIRRSVGLLFLLMPIMFLVGYILGEKEEKIKNGKTALLQLFAEWLKENNV